MLQPSQPGRHSRMTTRTHVWPLKAPDVSRFVAVPASETVHFLEVVLHMLTGPALCEVGRLEHLRAPIGSLLASEGEAWRR